MPSVVDISLDIVLTKTICVWDYNHLPNCLKNYIDEKCISTSDLDWIALRPSIYDEEYIPWLSEPYFGCCEVKEHPIDKIRCTLILGYHA